MIGMDFGGFVILLIAGLISALVIHYGADYRGLTGTDGFLMKWIVGWIGAWLGSPVLGHWFSTWNYGNVYFIPALIGAFVGSFAIAASWKAAAAAHKSQDGVKPHEIPRAA